MASTFQFPAGIRDADECARTTTSQPIKKPRNAGRGGVWTGEASYTSSSAGPPRNQNNCDDDGDDSCHEGRHATIDTRNPSKAGDAFAMCNEFTTPCESSLAPRNPRFMLRKLHDHLASATPRPCQAGLRAQSIRVYERVGRVCASKVQQLGSAFGHAPPERSITPRDTPDAGLRTLRPPSRRPRYPRRSCPPEDSLNNCPQSVRSRVGSTASAKHRPFAPNV